MGSSSVWGVVRSFAVTEYDWSCDLGIFQSWWLKVMSPYIPHKSVQPIQLLSMPPLLDDPPLQHCLVNMMEIDPKDSPFSPPVKHIYASVWICFQVNMLKSLGPCHT